MLGCVLDANADVRNDVLTHDVFALVPVALQVEEIKDNITYYVDENQVRVCCASLRARL